MRFGPTLRYAAINAAYWSGFCLVIAFSSVFLLSRGLTNGHIGITLAASGFASALLQPVIADRAGRSGWPMRVWVALLAALVALGASLLMLPSPTPLRDAVVFSALLCVVQTVLPLVNTLGMDAAAHGVPVDFGAARAVGSLAFALTSTLVGAFVAATDTSAIPPLVVAAQALLVVAAVRSSSAAATRGVRPVPLPPRLPHRRRRPPDAAASPCSWSG